MFIGIKWTDALHSFRKLCSRKSSTLEAYGFNCSKFCKNKPTIVDPRKEKKLQ